MTEIPPTEREDIAPIVPAQGSRGFLLFLRDVLVIVVIAVVASFLIKTFLVRSFYIPSESMQQTLQIDDRILVNELVPRIIPLERGDVVVFKDPGGWLSPTAEVPSSNPLAASLRWFLDVIGLAPSDSNDHLIKRVIGLPGDTVACCDALGQMSVNGVPLDESAYVFLPPDVTTVSDQPFEVTVPADSLWVMGDNRYNSCDSRCNTGKPGGGFVPIDNLVGRAFVITWPASRWAWLDSYPMVFNGTDPVDAPVGPGG